METEHGTHAHGMTIEFLKGESEGRLRGLFTENGIMGVLEVADYNNIYVVSRFGGDWRLIMRTDN